jgi:hypothetical protein
LKRDGTGAETRFRLLSKQTRTQCSEVAWEYWLPTPFASPPPGITLCHHISTGHYFLQIALSSTR